MPLPLGYHSAPSTPSPDETALDAATYNDNNDEDEDDIDLDPTELDPVASSTRRSPSVSNISYDFGRRIPLRNLRFGGRRRPRDDSDAEDREALVNMEDETRKDGEDGLLLPGHEVVETVAARRISRQGMAELRPRRRKVLTRRWLEMLSLFRSNSIHLPVADTDNDNSSDPSDCSTYRTISIGHTQNPSSNNSSRKYPPNALSHAKYTAWSFLPRTLWNEFQFFFNLYFLLVALSQVVPALRIGYLSTYVAPLAFVVSVTLGKEAWDDVMRRRRDAEANREGYRVLNFVEDGGKSMRGAGRKRRVGRGSDGKRGKQKWVKEEGEDGDEIDGPSASVTEFVKPSRDLKVGDVLVLGKDQRVPADVIILKSFSPDTTGRRSISAQTLRAQDTSTEADSDTTLVEMGENAAIPTAELQEEAINSKRLENKTTSDDPSGFGEAFIRTDQLDGETDWKLRLASPLAQSLPTSEYVRLRIMAGPPDKKVNEFVGTIELLPKPPLSDSRAYYDPHITPDAAGASGAAPISPSNRDFVLQSAPLTIDHTAWANTVLASNTIIHAVVVYTGPQTRAALSTSPSRSKVGLLEYEINALTKILCVVTAVLSFVLVLLERVEQSAPAGQDPEQQKWYVAFTRFLILFSTIVPISLRVNLDMGKSVYAYFIHRDSGIPGTVVRTSTIPEDLGRVEYLLSDKTGTLTRNEMELRKVHVGTVSYGAESMEEVRSYVQQAFTPVDRDFGAGGALFTPSTSTFGAAGALTRTRREIGMRVRDLVLALALCHNVTPTTELDADTGQEVIAYQASSPDEIAIVRWTEAVGLRLAHRDRRSITLQDTRDGRTVVRVHILNVFPFTSESKRMGILVRFDRGHRGNVADDGGDDIVFFQKGADTVMAPIVATNDWLEEETGNMAREGLRTLVIGRKPLSSEQYTAFRTAYADAAVRIVDRDARMAQAVACHLEQELTLLGVTGVEDQLQAGVKPSLETLRNAGIKVWMLTGDKVETARCVAISSKLVARGQHIHTIAGLTHNEHALAALDPLHVPHRPTAAPTAALLIDGPSLALYLRHHRDAFIRLAVRLPAVIACRCSPAQKADVARLIRAHTRKRVACVGDGGNDVSMIQAADVGVGIVGKEGRQASLAADFSITQFAYLTKLLLWHGRNSYQRSAKLAQFVMHRGLIISVCQTVFSAASRFAPLALYRDWLLVGYATTYTMAPVFSLVLDRDVDEALANLYPELYKELTAGRSLSYRTFFVWVGISVYQGLVIQGGAQLLLPAFAANNAADPTTTPAFARMVTLSYCVLILNELLMVAVEVTTWHPVMIFALIGTAAAYLVSLPFLGGYFDLGFLITLGFWWRFAAIATASLGPVIGGKWIQGRVRPPSYRKVRGV
ncbi:hypothetical protein M433DRAFT_149960 [Acidomyces richmondensis BFW]|nr:MAG: hypothetical protein FE78DRAFT_93401 [Acidomyces sp. 'richmondensis']KYG49455.1 hypothetical protein M433DRAFT_149960 [Acidomyces richmondensis BFW]